MFFVRVDEMYFKGDEHEYDSDGDDVCLGDHPVSFSYKTKFIIYC
jgi:hypothetical protein